MSKVIYEYLDIAFAVNEDVQFVLRDLPFPLDITLDIVQARKREIVGTGDVDKGETAWAAIFDEDDEIREGVQMIVSRRYFKVVDVQGADPDPVTEASNDLLDAMIERDKSRVPGEG